MQPLGTYRTWITRSRIRAALVALGATLIVAALIATVIKWAPQWLASTSGLNPSQRAEEIGRVRTALLAVLAGGLATVGAVYTARTFGLSRQGHELARQGQITERFTRAVDQLGSEKLDVRFGGIYALERLARESHTDRATIGEVLTAYIRGHAPWPAHLDDQPPAKASEQIPTLKSRAPDVQAALTVLGRGRFPPVYRPLEGLDVSNTDLRRASLRATDPRESRLLGAHFEYTNFSCACLDQADLTYGYFEWANFGGARLVSANLTSAHLENAHLVEARFSFEGRIEGPEGAPAIVGALTPSTEAAGRTEMGGAHLDGADLRDAHLQAVNLTGAFLVDALLIGADLRGAILHNVSLHGARLEGARLDGVDASGATCDASTRWPSDFDWERYGVRVTPRPKNPRAYAVRFSGLQDDFAASLSTSRASTAPG